MSKFSDIVKTKANFCCRFHFTCSFSFSFILPYFSCSLWEFQIVFFKFVLLQIISFNSALNADIKMCEIWKKRIPITIYNNQALMENLIFCSCFEAWKISKMDRIDKKDWIYRSWRHIYIEEKTMCHLS